MQTMAQQQAILGGVGVCDRCRGPLDLSLSGDGTPGSQRGDAPLGDSYVVLPHKRVLPPAHRLGGHLRRRRRCQTSPTL